MLSNITRAMLAAGVLSSASVMAAPFTLPGGPLFVQYNNAEQFSPNNTIDGNGTAAGSPAEGNWGIVQVSVISKGTALPPPGSDIAGGGAPIFVQGQNGGNQVTGIFFGATTVAGGNSIGGRLDLYWSDVSTVNVGAELLSASNLTKRTAANTYLGFADPSLTFLGSFLFRPGCDAGHVNTICSPVVPGAADGTAKSYQDVILAAGGVWGPSLDTNYFTLDANNAPMGAIGPADIRTDSNFTANGASNWNIISPTQVVVGLRSNDPIRAVAIPEPGTVALLGLSLLGLAGLRRKNSA